MTATTKELILNTLEIKETPWGYRLANFQDGKGNTVSHALPWTLFNSSKEEVAEHLYESYYQ